MNIAIVDDNPKDSARIKKYVDTYFEQCKEHHQTFIYRNGLDFLDDMKRNFDIVFMDKEAP